MSKPVKFIKVDLSKEGLPCPSCLEADDLMIKMTQVCSALSRSAHPGHTAEASIFTAASFIAFATQYSDVAAMREGFELAATVMNGFAQHADKVWAGYKLAQMPASGSKN